MTEEFRMWLEIGFNLTYLLVIWWLVITMMIKYRDLNPAIRQQARLVVGAFGLLAIGDSGHVGFRVFAYLYGGLESSIRLMGFQISLVGLGALMTAVTVTIFYVLMLALWQVRFQKPYRWFEISIFIAAIVRLALMMLPVNQWQLTVPPQPWSLVRNVPLIFMGISIAYLILREALKVKDQTFTWIGIMILLSYACYLPVILFVQQNPLIGMLMIPKTLAYVAIGFLAYNDLYHVHSIQSVDVKKQGLI